MITCKKKKRKIGIQQKFDGLDGNPDDEGIGMGYDDMDKRIEISQALSPDTVSIEEKRDDEYNQADEYE